MNMKWQKKINLALLSNMQKNAEHTQIHKRRVSYKALKNSTENL